MAFYMSLLLESCGGVIEKVANSAGSSNKFTIACDIQRTGGSVCHDTCFTSRSIFVHVPFTRINDLVKILGEGFRRQFKPGSSHSSILTAPLIYVTGDIRFELCFMQMKIGYRFNE